MKRFVCLHGHFYQPPRENPWLEAIERQASAAPYHDWNERVAAEAYAPNAAARVLDERDRIRRLANNYERLSFNVGPTLMAWLETSAPEAYAAILEADARGAERNGGHGPAIAQPYGHPILPLCGERDKRTQVVWGIRDFETRFGRRPEGMWLPETAVDLASLEALAAEGLRFTVLAPHQAARWRPLEGDAEGWRPGGEGGVDPRRPYLQRLPSGREIALFFYDGPLSRGVAFEGLLKDGARFADRIREGFEPSREEPQLVHLATDGETFGHHHRHGEMALAFALDRLEAAEGVEVVDYARYLAAHPPAHEVQVAERTSWSCSHGLERWRSDCGCHTGGEPGWDQRWRKPLREALDILRSRIDPAWEEAAGRRFPDPWAARDAYVDVILDRSPAGIDRFLEAQGAGGLAGAERVEALELMEIQRHALLVYTSCGWFFNDLAGIETVQVLRYAARAAELAERRLGIEVEEPFLERLAEARSNRPGVGDGRAVWEALVRPSRVGRRRACANDAARTLVEAEEGVEVADARRLHAFRIEELAGERRRTGRAALRLAAVRATVEVTGDSGRYLSAVLHLGEGSLAIGVRELGDAEAAEAGGEARALLSAAGPLADAFEAGDFAGAIGHLAEAFGPETYSLADLLVDERSRLVDRLLRSTLEDVEGAYERLYERHAPLMEFLRRMDVPQPAALEVAGAFVLRGRLRRHLETEEPDLDRVEAWLEEAKDRGVDLADPALSVAFRSACVRLARAVAASRDDPAAVRGLSRAVELARRGPAEIELREVQDAYWRLLGSSYPELRARAEAGEPSATEWTEAFERLGRRLGFAVEAITPPTTSAPTGATRRSGSWR